MENERLFQEFPPVSTRQWKEKIIKDLKGADYNKKLVWKTGEGFTVEPFYRREDLSQLPFIHTGAGQFPFLRGKNSEGNHWKINEQITFAVAGEGNRMAKEALEKGAESITFLMPDELVPDENNLRVLLDGINLQKIPVHIRCSNPLLALKNLIALDDNASGSVQYDPLMQLSRSGKFINSEEEDLNAAEEMLRLAKKTPNLRTLTVDAELFDNSGADIVTSMAFGLSTGLFYVDYLTDKGFQPDEIFSKIIFRYATGGNYFMEIAKLRALRFLWAKIAGSYGIIGKEAAMTIHTVNSLWNKTIYDPYVNMLRTTTETMSAIIGGADEITTRSFDTLHPVRPEMGKRIARNQQLILRLESYLDKVADISAGSYYIENLTKKLIDEAWKLFLETEEKGGYLKAFKEGFITGKIEEEANRKETEIATRKRNILGVNQFPNLTETITESLPSWLFEKETAGKAHFNPLKPRRGAAAFEALRLETDRYSKTHKRPQVWMFTYGDLAMRRARAQFAGNFFGCAGYEIIDNNGFDTVEEGIEAARKAKPEIVVLCSSDAQYSEIALPVFKALKNDTIVVLAGNPQPLTDELKARGFEHFIHVKTNVLETLKQFQKLLKINTHD